MIVFIAGMQRSGSTFSFNIARELLQRRGSVSQAPTGNITEALENSETSDHLIIKGHSASDATLKMVASGAARVICTIRKPEDAIASWMDTFGFELEASISYIQEWERMFRCLEKYALVLKFDEIDKNPLYAAAKIGFHLFSYRGAAEATSISKLYTKTSVLSFLKLVDKNESRKVDIGFSVYDKETFFHKNHVVDKRTRHASDRLKSDQILYIRERLAYMTNERGEIKMG